MTIQTAKSHKDDIYFSKRLLKHLGKMNITEVSPKAVEKNKCYIVRSDLGQVLPS